MKPLELLPLDEIVDEFQFLDEREACQYLEELGRQLPDFPSEHQVAENLVPGCQSRVWLVLSLTPGASPAVEIQADSDALVVKGLVFIVMCMFNGRAPREILDFDYVKFFDDIGLGKLILPQRKNGLFSMVKQVRTFAASAIGAAGDAGEPAARTGESSEPKHAASGAPTRSIANVKAEFPTLNKPLPSGAEVVFLDSGASAQKPLAVIDKEREVEEEYFANAFRGRYYFGSRVDEEIEGARERVRRMINAEAAEEVIFTSGTTMSINLVANAWGRKFLQPGDELVLNIMEHHANLVPWQRIAAERGAVLRFIPLTDDGQLDLDDLNGVVHSKTKLIAVCGMSNVLGTINPIDRIAERAREVGSLVLVDGAQSVPHQPVDVRDPRIDFLAFSGHKLYGPTGVGVLYARRELLDAMDPFLGGGHMIERVYQDHATWADPPAKFEAGTLPIVQIVGLGAAVDFVESIGFDAIQRHEHDLLQYAQRRLHELAGITIYGPSIERKGAIVSFSIDGLPAEDLAWRLDGAGICTRHGHHCTMPLHDWLGVPATTRASFAVYNNRSDADALYEAVLAACRERGIG